MGLTITEKILLAHTRKKGISADEFIEARVDLVLANDITAPLAIREFEQAGAKKVFDRRKVVLVCDHFTPNKDAPSARQCRMVEDFARKYKIAHFYPLGIGGIEHTLLPDAGLVLPGSLILGADSHTCTYGAVGAFSTGSGSTDAACAWITGRVWLRVPRTMKFIFTGKLNKWVGGKDLILHTIGDIGVSGALYKAMEFCGPVIRDLPIEDRFTMCNMAIEAGAKSGIIEPDEITERYLRNVLSSVRAAGAGPLLNPDFAIGFEENGLTSCQDKACEQKNRRRIRCNTARTLLRAQRSHGKKLETFYQNPIANSGLKSDPDAVYSDTREYDVSRLEPQVACPHLPSNVKPAGELGDVRIDQAVIGSCTNGRLADLRLAASVLKGRKADSRVRLLVFPATQQIYRAALQEGLMDIFVKAGGVIAPPTCGPCLGGHMGVLAEDETAIATTNRNFRGRMGALSSKVYLANPAVTAASAIKGRIAHPEEIGF